MTRKLTACIIGAALISVSLLTTPAHADCAADIEKLEVRALPVGQNSSLRQKLDERINKAKELLAKGKKKGCAKQIKLANQLMDKVAK